MNWNDWIGRLLGQENVQSIDDWRTSFEAPWASGSPVWLIFAAILIGMVSLVFYTRWQSRGRRSVRIVLACSRAALLTILVLILANPILTIETTSRPRPLLWLLLDGTDSMNIQDDLPSDEQALLATAVGLDQPAGAGTSEAKADPAAAPAADKKLSRADYVQAWLRKPQNNVLSQLEENFRVQAFVLDHPDQVRQIDLTPNDEDEIDLEQAAAELQEPQGQVTALGKAFDDLATRHATSNVAGLIVVSDFGWNTGPAPIGSERSPVKRLGVPIYTVGVGPESAVNLGVDLQAPLVMKKAEDSTLGVTLRQSGLAGHRVNITVTAHPVSGDAGSTDQMIEVGEREVTLEAPTASEEFTFRPDQTGQFEFVAQVEPLEEEIVDQDNRAVRRVDIRDDFLRLLFVEHEPTWEWRFIKEVFHRDKLVGLRGFRTYLRSADRSVRKTNELFWENLQPTRSEFFANDVIFIGDMPRETLNERFCEMTKEFVGKFGGGLVVIAGPRFGVGQLADTPLADMLPVVVDPTARLRDEREFELRLTPYAAAYDFMRLGTKDAAEAEQRRAWNNLGPLPWYQPVARPHQFATVLADHPTETCVDGKTPQPLIAIRPYGRGEVIYVGFNETWRLRRKYGELYYRQFWAQMIHRLGLSHAVGTQKRFVVRTDRQRYKSDDEVILTVEAYDKNFDALSDKDVPDRKLTGELLLPSRAEDAEPTRPISVSLLRDGVFEARVRVFAPGEHRIRVKDPISRETAEVNFQVASLSVERRSAVRNVELERQIATANGGKMYSLETASQMANDIQLKPLIETSVKVFPLWSTWLCFGLVVLLMLGEWLGRKAINLP